MNFVSFESQCFPRLRLGKHLDSRETKFTVPSGPVIKCLMLHCKCVVEKTSVRHCTLHTINSLQEISPNIISNDWVYCIDILMTAFLTIFRRFPTIFRIFPKIIWNARRTFPNIFWRLPTLGVRFFSRWVDTSRRSWRARRPLASRVKIA